MSDPRSKDANGSSEAGYWYVRHESDVELSPLEWQAWEKWCADPDHDHQYDQVVWLRSKMKSCPRPLLEASDELVRLDCAAEGARLHSLARCWSLLFFQRRALVWAVAAISAFAVLATMLPRTLPLQRTQARLSATPEALPYSTERLQELRISGRPVLVNLRAGWCPTCIVNERTTLSQKAVRELMTRKHIAYLKGEWTEDNIAVNAALKQFGRKGIPLYLLYCPGARDPKVLPEVLTENLMVQELSRLPD